MSDLPFPHERDAAPGAQDEDDRVRTLRWRIAPAVAAGLLATSGIALGALGVGAGSRVSSVSVTVGKNSSGQAWNAFSPGTLTITQGDGVVFANANISSGGSPVYGYHNVVFSDGPTSGVASSTGWEWSRAFNTPGTYTFYCQPHQSSGMTGTIVVLTAQTEAPPQPSPPPPPPSQSQTPPSSTPASQLDDVEPEDEEEEDTTPPEFLAASVRTCRSSTKACRKVKPLLLLELDEDATVAGTLLRHNGRSGFRRAGSVRFDAATGKSEAALSLAGGRALGRGSWRLVITATDAAGNGSESRTLTFTVA